MDAHIRQSQACKHTITHMKAQWACKTERLIFRQNFPALANNTITHSWTRGERTGRKNSSGVTFPFHSFDCRSYSEQLNWSANVEFTKRYRQGKKNYKMGGMIKEKLHFSWWEWKKLGDGQRLGPEIIQGWELNVQCWQKSRAGECVFVCRPWCWPGGAPVCMALNYSLPT